MRALKFRVQDKVSQSTSSILGFQPEPCFDKEALDKESMHVTTHHQWKMIIMESEMLINKPPRRYEKKP